MQIAVDDLAIDDGAVGPRRAFAELRCPLQNAQARIMSWGSTLGFGLHFAAQQRAGPLSAYTDG